MILKHYLELTKTPYKEFAKKIGTSERYLGHIVNRVRRASPDMATKIESASCGKVSRMECLYPEDFFIEELECSMVDAQSSSNEEDSSKIVKITE